MQSTSATLRCPCCAGTTFTQPGAIASSGAQAVLLTHQKPAFFSQPVTAALSGRACTTCGFVMLFGDLKDVAEIAKLFG